MPVPAAGPVAPSPGRRTRSLVAELAHYIKTQTSEQPEDPWQLQMLFPSFLWLVRDFALELKLDGRDITANEYLENALKPAKVQWQRGGGRAHQLADGCVLAHTPPLRLPMATAR